MGKSLNCCAHPKIWSQGVSHKVSQHWLVECKFLQLADGAVATLLQSSTAQWCVGLRGIVFSCVALCCAWCNNMPRCVKCCFQSCTCCAMCSTGVAPGKHHSRRNQRGLGGVRRLVKTQDAQKHGSESSSDCSELDEGLKVSTNAQSWLDSHDFIYLWQHHDDSSSFGQFDTIQNCKAQLSKYRAVLMWCLNLRPGVDDES